MPKIYKISKTGLRLFYKVRHHRGHGIHSPFVFNLITNVIEEKLPYYAYREIKEYIDSRPLKKKGIAKSDLLAFRLVNFFSAKSILEIGSGYGITSLYLTAPSSQSVCICVESTFEKYEIAEKLYKDWQRNIFLYPEIPSGLNEIQDCIYINLKNYKMDTDRMKEIVFRLTGPESFIIIRGIRTNKSNHLLWRNLIHDERVVTSLDLFTQGILFFNPKLYKRNYKISF